MPIDLSIRAGRTAASVTPGGAGHEWLLAKRRRSTAAACRRVAACLRQVAGKIRASVRIHGWRLIQADRLTST
ncbi:hypothetical protein GCM10007235_02480 [Pseudoxanthomonas indica]|nr:hypothetical protein GCM10007235_02480 [Pseudoxanthomonas indica]